MLDLGRDFGGTAREGKTLGYGWSLGRGEETVRERQSTGKLQLGLVSPKLVLVCEVQPCTDGINLTVSLTLNPPGGS